MYFSITVNCFCTCRIVSSYENRITDATQARLAIRHDDVIKIPWKEISYGMYFVEVSVTLFGSMGLVYLPSFTIKINIIHGSVNIPVPVPWIRNG